MTPPASKRRRVLRAPLGFPSREDARRAYDEADLNRAIQAYRFFYPTVSGASIIKGSEACGLVPNKIFGVLDSKPIHVGFTLNSDTPYAPLLLDLRDGPMVVELPPGPLIVVAMDVHQRWIADMGIPGPDQGNGGRHLIIPPGWEGDIPDGYHVANSTTNCLLVGARSLPVEGDVEGAIERLKTIAVHPLEPREDWAPPVWIDLTPSPQDTTPLRYEGNFGFWDMLNGVIQREPAYEGYRDYYGELAALGIAKGKEFDPDARMRKILEHGAALGLHELRAQAFADRRPDRVVWRDRAWEWVGLRYEDGDFNTSTYVDLDARETWFYQAIGASPAMFRRKPGSGSLYWLGLHDIDGEYLDGGNHYMLRIPQPVPASLFWSVTVYDAESRSQIQTDQGFAALRSMFELASCANEPMIELQFGPEEPKGAEKRWIKTVPGKGWFVYFRIYGPQDAAFDGSWKPGDFVRR